LLTQVVSRSLWHFYDALGRLLVANLIWSAVTTPLSVAVVFFSRLFDAPLSTVVLASVLPVVFLNPTSLALGEMTHRLAETGDTDLRTFASGLRQHAVRGVLLMSVGALITTVLGVSLLFYGNATFTPLGQTLNAAATGVTIWAILLVAGMSVYWVPVAVGLPGRSPRLGFTFKRSALLTLEAPGLTAGVLLLTVAATLFWVGTVLGAFAFWMGFVRVLHAETHQILRERQDAAARLRNRGTPPTRLAVRAELKRVWDEQPKRRLRELLRPWDA
jgi:hypothetical protein